MLNKQGLYPKSNHTKPTYLEDIAKIYYYSMIALTDTLTDTKEPYIILYRPPGTTETSFNESLGIISNYIVNTREIEAIMILGDFNFPFIDWEIKKIKMGANATKDEKQQARMLLDFEENFYLNQIINIPREENILDLVFISIEDVRNISSTYTAQSDHK